jgi:hypothetical protein
MMPEQSPWGSKTGLLLSRGRRPRFEVKASMGSYELLVYHLMGADSDPQRALEGAD